MNWKTTFGGIASILTGLAGLALMLAKGQMDGTVITASFSAITSGAGLIFAKDWNVTGGNGAQRST